MCLAIPGKIVAFIDSKSEDIKYNSKDKIAEKKNYDVEVEGIYARVIILGVESDVNIQLIEFPRVGDYVLVHAGCAIQRIDTEYFDYLVKTYQTWLEEY